MKSLQRLGLFAASLMILAAVSTIVGKAAVTITTPNSTRVDYTLAAGGTSAPITPATSLPVIVMGTNTTSTNFAVSTLTMVHIQGVMLRWVGIEAGTGTVTHGGSTSLGTHIVWLDNSNKVGLQVLSADEFVIHNGSTSSQSGTVRLIW